MDQIDHAVALKVMRLTRPTLVTSSIISSEPKDLVQDVFTQILGNESSIVKGAETFACGEFMLLPQSFGNIYLGETFSCCICIHNCTNHAVNGVNVKADLQSNSTRISLPIHTGKTTPVTISPTETLDDVIHHEVKEIGTHILVCEVHYITAAGLPQSFRKFFKFQVITPLNVETKFYSTEVNEIFLQASIQNVTTTPMCLEKVELETAPGFTATSLNTLANGESVFLFKQMLQPQNSCQFVYCIKPTEGTQIDNQSINIGKLDIVWRSNLGERGRLQTSQLQRSAFNVGDLKVSIVEAASSITIGNVFRFTCRVTNTSTKAMDIKVVFNNKSDSKSSYSGSTNFMLGTLAPEDTKEFSIAVYPLKEGFITITNLILIDLISKKPYEFENLIQVYVVSKSKETESNGFLLNKYVKYV